MAEYKILAKKRKMRQFIMGAVFLIFPVAGWKYPLLGYFIPLCMLLGIGIGLFKGRKWCDWFCPRGSFSDAFVKPVSPKRKIPRFFKGLPLRFGFLSFLMLMITLQIIKRWPDSHKIGMFFVMLLTVTTILGIILAFVFHQRTWCCFCPIGSLANWAGRRKYLLRIDSGLCTECRLCLKVCPIQVAPFEFKKEKTAFVTDGDCLKCGLCAVACPKKALRLF